MNKELAVLLPYYNNLPGLRLTLESLIGESKLFTLFFFDDGSDNEEKVKEVIDDFSDKFKIVYKRSANNQGITKTLNTAIKYILELNRFCYLAKLHAGDLCLNNRLKKQKLFLENHKDIYLVGSWVKFVNMNRELLFIFKPPTQHQKIKRAMHMYNPFMHPTIMFKIEIIHTIGYYPENYPALEDHAFFFKIIKNFKTAIIDEVLLEYEINPNAITNVMRTQQTKSRMSLLWNEYKFGLIPTLGLIRALLTFLLPLSFLTFMKRQFFYR